MKLIQGTTEFELDGDSAVAIGKFDGIHLGHQKLLSQILSWKKEGLQAVVFTFDPPPAIFFQRKIQKELTTREEKRKLFEKMGIDVLVEFPFNHNTAATTPKNFVSQILVGKLHTKKIAAGYDLSFGYGGSGNFELLQILSKEYQFQVKFFDKVCLDGNEISSTYVREEVEKGNMQLVTKLLGTPYTITGIVQHGKKLGRTIEMPTVNLLPVADKLLPPFGVYFSNIYHGERMFRGVTNIGYRPTVSDNRTISVETFIYDFNENLYGEEIIVALLFYRRSEMKFDSVEELKWQMQRDRDAGKNYFQNID